MKHILFIYPHNTIYKTKDLAEEFADILLGFSTSDNIKYTFGLKYIVLHFKTNLDVIQELEDTLDVFSHQNGVDFTYFLVPVVYGYSTNISPDIRDYLNNLDNKPTHLYDEVITENNFFFQLENFVSDIRNIESDLSIDEILDKINEKGIDSLTKNELNKLNNQSKNY